MIYLEHSFSLPPCSASLLGLAVFLLALYIFSLNPQERGNEPPGPRALPVIGNLLQLDLKKPYNTLCELSKTYGTVFTVHFGPKKMVVLTGYETVKQALVNHAEEFGERDIMPIFHDMNQGNGIILANGESWREMRRFTLSTLKDFGMGKKIIQDKIIEECRYLIEEFQKHKGKSFEMTRPLQYATSNIITSMVYGSRYEYNNPIFQRQVDRAHKSIQLSGSVGVQMYNLCTWLGPWLKQRNLLLKHAEEDKEEIRALIENLKDTLNPQMPRCFIDAFLAQQKTLEESGDMGSHYHDDNLVNCVSNLFKAGTDTSGVTLTWALLFMAKYPHIQDQVQEELDRVIGSRQAQVEDRKNLPYTDAVIHETQRMASIVPLSLPHMTSRDVTFQGYFIKKGTAVIPLLHSVLYDENEWETPHTFNPNHFLDSEGKFVKRDAFLPFSAGRRACPGEGLARMELFLFFTSLLQHFRFTPPPGVTEGELDLTPGVGLVTSPLPHQLCAISRF